MNNFSVLRITDIGTARHFDIIFDKCDVLEVCTSENYS